MTESSFGNVEFENSVLYLAAFGNSKLEKVIFQDSSLKSTDYYDYKLKKVEFERCNLDGASFEQTSINGIDISSSAFDKLTVSIEDLNGCKVSTNKAIQFASLMGLIIKDLQFTLKSKFPREVFFNTYHGIVDIRQEIVDMFIKIVDIRQKFVDIPVKFVDIFIKIVLSIDGSFDEASLSEEIYNKTSYIGCFFIKENRGGFCE